MKKFKKRVTAMLMALAVSSGVYSALSMPYAGAVNTSQIVRVGLCYGSTALVNPKLENVDTSGYTLGTYHDQIFTADTTISNRAITMKVANGSIQVLDTDSGAVVYTLSGTTENFAIRPNSTLTWFNGYQWYGDFVYQKTIDGSFSVINYVELEDYVKGVLPYEMSPSWSIEALKAQAVCTRSYALGSLDKHGSTGFDLCNTTHCQVYLGANQANSNSNAAVDSTTGEYLTYNGKLAVGYFFSSDGGATEDAANVWGGNYGYLKGKIDPYEDSANALKSVWSETFTAAQIKTKLNAAGYSIGDVTNVQVTKRTAMNNVCEVTVTDNTGNQVVVNQAKVRTVFGVNSIRYTITPDTALTKPAGNAMLASTIKKTVGQNMDKSSQAAKKADEIALSTHKLTVDGVAKTPQAYLVNKENYFKLRDIAYILSGTETQFNVSFDAEKNNIVLTKDATYLPVGGEMASSTVTKVQSCTDSNSTIVLNGTPITLKGYRINGNNYYRVRDLSRTLGFAVDFDASNMTVLLNSSGGSESQNPDNTVENSNEDAVQPKPNDAVQTTSTPTKYTFEGTGWGHNVGMSQYGALGMAKQGYQYDEILEFYYTDIKIAK